MYGKPRVDRARGVGMNDVFRVRVVEQNRMIVYYCTGFSAADNLHSSSALRLDDNIDVFSPTCGSLLGRLSSLRNGLRINYERVAAVKLGSNCISLTLYPYTQTCCNTAVSSRRKTAQFIEVVQWIQ